MKSILILLTAFVLTGFAAEQKCPRIHQGEKQEQHHNRQEIKNPELKNKLEKIKILHEKIEALKKEIKKIKNKKYVKYHDRDGDKKDRK